ncbi:DUF2642 domain-containing protein [Sporosarcina sp. Te-1]|uniref:DUF2642 domain-containing protein n=1 Tax=Sporosarcina sp. Te-1 TaxID=2818390 RepID=UPI001A9D7C17|nr:DUF2642 domain-containing protein [Sporosarcina sp. Te-1]QTD42956.1 DUF2642 domain-containing protein [Sporosarcina sp. Te-1]
MINRIDTISNVIVTIEVSGRKQLTGTVIEVGKDLVVLCNGIDFIYIPLAHIQNSRIDDSVENVIEVPTDPKNVVVPEDGEDFTLLNVLQQSLGKGIEIYVTGRHSLFGYITEILDDYFVFWSPLHKNIYVKLSHLKWLIPYPPTHKFYGMVDETSLLQVKKENNSRTFEEKVQELKNRVVMINGGESKKQIGKLNDVTDQFVEIQTAKMRSEYLNIEHIKTIYQAY